MTESTPSQLKEEIYKEWLRPVEDPELYLSLVDLGLIYGVTELGEKKVQVRMTLTSPGCPAGDYLVDQVKKRMEEHPSVEAADVQIVWEPKWNPSEMASEEAKESLGLW